MVFNIMHGLNQTIHTSECGACMKIISLNQCFVSYGVIIFFQVNVSDKGVE